MADTKAPINGYAMIDLPANEHIRAFGIPGNTAHNAIPPSDSPRYREFQRALGLRPNEHISTIVGNRKIER